MIRIICRNPGRKTGEGEGAGSGLCQYISEMRGVKHGFGMNFTPHGRLTRHIRATKHQRQARASTGSLGGIGGGRRALTGQRRDRRQRGPEQPCQARHREDGHIHRGISAVASALPAPSAGGVGLRQRDGRGALGRRQQRKQPDSVPVHAVGDGKVVGSGRWQPHDPVGARAWAPEFGGGKWVSEGSRLAELERGVWF